MCEWRVLPATLRSSLANKTNLRVKIGFQELNILWLVSLNWLTVSHSDSPRLIDVFKLTIVQYILHLRSFMPTYCEYQLIFIELTMVLFILKIHKIVAFGWIIYLQFALFKYGCIQCLLIGFIPKKELWLVIYSIHRHFVLIHFIETLNDKQYYANHISVKGFFLRAF